MQSAANQEADRPLAIIILAAGLGTRMKSGISKVLHEVCGKPMISWVTDAVRPLQAERHLVVLGNGRSQVEAVLPEGAEAVHQDQQLGTGHAVSVCEPALAGFNGDILVLYGDTPLLRAETLRGLLAAHNTGPHACTLLTVELEEPYGYGRVVRDTDGRVTGIIEEQDAGDQEKAIREVNAGVYVFAADRLWPAIAALDRDNAQGELYLTDVIGVLATASESLLAHRVKDAAEILGVNSRIDLAEAAGLMRRRLLEEHMLAGVTVDDPATTYIEAGVRIGGETLIRPMTTLTGATEIGEDCVIGPSAVLRDTSVADGAEVISSYLDGAAVGSGCRVGPYAYLRPGARLAAGSQAGTFVEIKNSSVGAGAKVPHLSYIGDAEIGPGTNIAAGNITANYDGVSKHRTVIGGGVHTGADTVFVAPVTVGDGAMTGAGSVITGDVPAGGLGIARARQRNVESYASRKLGEGKGRQDDE